MIAEYVYPAQDLEGNTHEVCMRWNTKEIKQVAEAYSDYLGYEIDKDKLELVATYYTNGSITPTFRERKNGIKI